ncbi:MAG: 4Fe-4S binding protein [Elusimicrobia bacterium]|nr:4Fe-4S binding protein [Elusimicrobiota bacterium]
MGHAAGKDLYRRLGEKVDGLSCRAPWNETLREILKGLYSEEEADLLVRMPAGASTIGRLVEAAGLPDARLRTLLEGMAAKGLVVDLCLDGESYFMPAPMVIGFFEFTMMRSGVADVKRLSRLFHDYIEEGGGFYQANFGAGEKVSVMRALPHEEAFRPEVGMEVLDYEKASAIVSAADKAAMGACACRHKARHLGLKPCSVPPGVCTSFGYAADFLIRRGLAREASKREVRDALARSRDLGLVLNADNVRRNVTFICHCCKCCCMALRGIAKHGYPNAVMSSSFICEVAEDRCSGCGACVSACPISAMSLAPRPAVEREALVAEVDQTTCLGCGVCVMKCRDCAASLARRGKRVIHPETTFRKIILGCLERGTLQNQLFAEPGNIGQDFMRAAVGAFLGLSPVKRALMSDALRSVFLKAVEAGARLKGQGWATEL